MSKERRAVVGFERSSSRAGIGFVEVGIVGGESEAMSGNLALKKVVVLGVWVLKS